MTTEERRLAETQARRAHWRRWGPYLSERQWGTVREDYSPSGTAWDAFPPDHARSRAYRWGEDGLLGISDNHQRLCFALALWNEKDPILKERLFGLTGSEGNHGEDVKDYYFYLEPDVRDRFPGFRRRLEWFIRNRPEFREHIQAMARPDGGERRLLSVVTREQLAQLLRFMLDEREFLSPYGIRAVSQHHRDHPYVLTVDGREHRVDYEPAESSTGLFGGNSNWRGPIWFPINFLLIEALQKFDHVYGPDFQVECPTGSGARATLWDVATELSRGLTRIVLRGPNGRRPVHGGVAMFQTDPHWRELVWFYEYFHGDNGAGIGASHQTGWTGLVAKLLQQSGR